MSYHPLKDDTRRRLRLQTSCRRVNPSMNQNSSDMQTGGCTTMLQNSSTSWWCWEFIRMVYYVNIVDFSCCIASPLRRRFLRIMRVITIYLPIVWVQATSISDSWAMPHSSTNPEQYSHKRYRTTHTRLTGYGSHKKSLWLVPRSPHHRNPQPKQQQKQQQGNISITPSATIIKTHGTNMRNHSTPANDEEVACTLWVQCVETPIDHDDDHSNNYWSFRKRSTTGTSSSPTRKRRRGLQQQLWFRYQNNSNNINMVKDKDNNGTMAFQTLQSNSFCFSITMHPDTSRLDNSPIDVDPDDHDISNHMKIMSSSTESLSPEQTTACRIQTCSEQDLPSHWIPLQGIYGLYQLPTGILWVLITDSELVYEIIPSHDYSNRQGHHHNQDQDSDQYSFTSSSSSSSAATAAVLWQIRRIRAMELFHQPSSAVIKSNFPSSSSSSSSSPSYASIHQQKKETARQLQLLRQAMKEHDFYYVPQSSSYIVPDMTRTLQQSFRMIHRGDSSLNDGNPNDSEYLVPPTPNVRKWWKMMMTPKNKVGDLIGSSFIGVYPDSRFFWNENAVLPLLQTYLKNTRQNKNADPTTTRCLEILLDHVIPVTSAFCNVHRNMSVFSSSLSSSATDSGWRYDQLLISRRSRFRAGTRFTKRGADAAGHVANFAETEQICVVHNNLNHSSIIQNHYHPNQSSLPSSLELYSHVQIRGSIPLRWSSPTDVTTYRPRVRIGTDPLAQARAVWAHIAEQLQRYTMATNAKLSSVPQLIFCNLIDKNSDQGRLGRAFDAVLQAVVDVYQELFKFRWNSQRTMKSEDDMMPSQNPSTAVRDKVNTMANEGSTWLMPWTLHHIWFDFHANVKGGKWDKLGTLLQELSPTLDHHGYFVARLDGRGWKVFKEQSGVVRTNCMDCLDRTNVVQSIIGRYMLFRSLSTMKRSTLSSKSQSRRRDFPLEYTSAFRRESCMRLPWAVGETAHRLLWADNADAISRLYAGTPALKGDFTRTGKRTKRGAIDDGMNSLQRYYLNNFLDADRQEGIDLMIGEAQFTTPRELMEATIIKKKTLDSPNQDESPKEMVRSFLLRGIASNDDTSSDERFHVRIKHRRKHSLRKRAGSDSFLPSLLKLRWLPGDLQAQMRSRAVLDDSPPQHPALMSPASHLEAMEHRLGTEVPWWVGEDFDTEMDSLISPSDDEVAGTNVGHIVGALIAAYQAPLTTATLTLAILGLLLEHQSRSKK